MMRKIVLSVLVLCALTTAAAAQVHVNGYFRRDGTYVQPHYRSAPDGNPYNNWSTQRRGLDATIPLQAGQGVTPIDPYAFQRGMLVGQEIRLRQQEIQLRQMELDRLQRR
jgi:opacity protein-like surface antigen